MANDKFRKTRLRSKARLQAAQDWDAPKAALKQIGKRSGGGRRKQGAG